MADTHAHDNGRNGAYAFEHTLGWLMAITALALAGVGLLVGFGVIGGSEQGINIDDAAGAGAAGASDWMQGALWLLPAIAAALLSRALHAADHHDAYRDSTANAGYSIEHAGAYLAALVTIAAAALAPLVGFDVFDNGNVAEDGILWGVASIVPAVVTGTLHTVRHHQSVVVREREETDIRPTPATRVARGPR